MKSGSVNRGFEVLTRRSNRLADGMDSVIGKVAVALPNTNLSRNFCSIGPYLSQALKLQA